MSKTGIRVFVFGEDELRGSLIPLYFARNGSATPQSAYIEIVPLPATNEAEVTADYNPEDGPPWEVYRCRKFWVPVSACVNGRELAEYLNSKSFKAQVRRVVRGYHTTWDGNYRVGRLTVGAQEALDKIKADLENLGEEHPITIYEYLPDVIRRVGDTLEIEDIGTISAQTTDHEIDDMVRQMMEQFFEDGTAISTDSDDCCEYLQDMRDELQEEAS